jgi:radical SAM enzyme (TIGR01210 family)
VATTFSDRDVLAARPPKNAVDPARPYAFLVEPERTAEGAVEPVATIFLTNRECPFRCVFCDLWRNTLDDRVPPGAILRQIDYALARLPPARHVKLYNSGNFFDAQAIPPEEHPAIAARCREFQTVIVENHPRLCGPACVGFRDLVAGRLEVALGLETAHEPTLARLNKRMTLDDFARAVEYLRQNEVAVRAFVVLRPPWTSEEEGVQRAVRSIDYAFRLGVSCCSVIPTRGGNGLLERLAAAGEFSPPRLASMERVMDAAVPDERGRVFVDLWDAERFFDCGRCGPARLERLRLMNDTQQRQPPVACDCGGGP